MNRKQKVILSLLKEIDEICRKNNIEYYLSPRLTLCAVEGLPFPQNPYFGVVLMKTAEMERFRQAVENDPREKRALESMKTHKYFPGFYLRYENTDTVCLNLDCPREYAYPGLGIMIYPLRANGDSGMKKRWSTFEEKGWLENIDQPADEKGFKTFCSKMLIKLRCQLTGRQWTARKIYEDLCRSQQDPAASKYSLKRKKQVTVYPAKLFEKTQTVELEGEKFQVPKNIKKYLTISYGSGYRQIREPKYSVPGQSIISARVSYAELWKEWGSFDRFVKERLKSVRKVRKSRKMKDYFEESWDYVEFCGKRMNLGISYERKKDYILNLYKNEDYVTLEKVFRPYFKMMQKSLEKGEIFAEDEEILDIYIDVLEKTGKTEQREKIGILI